MACISWTFIENVLIWLVILGAVVALVKLLLPLVLGQLGMAASVILQAISIIVYAVVAIFVIVIVFDLISCLLSGAGGLRLR